MVADKKKIAADCWKKGSEALGKENWDYSIKMFTMAAELVPDNVMYRQTLRGAEKRKYGDNKTGARMAKVKLLGVRARSKKSQARKAWADMAKAAEDGLLINPWDAGFNADLGAACAQLGFSEVAVYGYELAVDAEPNNMDYLRTLAGLYEERGDYTRAVKLWERVRKLAPNDGEARSKVTGLTASSALDKGRYEEAESTQDVMSPDEMARKLSTSRPADGPGSSVEADLQRQIRKDPENKDNYLKLAEHYRRNGKFEESLENFQKALQLSGGDYNIREQVEDAELELLRRNWNFAKDAAQENSDDQTARQNAVALAKELLSREIEIFSTRTERYPNDMRYKMELANRFMRVQKWAQAIPLFQQAVNDPRLKAQALLSLGKCFNYDKKPDLARRQFEKAIPEISHETHPEQFKEAHYFLACLLHEVGRREEAEDHYNEVLAVDYDFKDVRERLEKLQLEAGS